MAYLRQEGPFIMKSKRIVEYLDQYPWSRTTIVSEPSTTRTYTLVKVNSTSKRTKPVDLIRSVTEHTASREFTSRASYRHADGSYGPSAYQATRYLRSSSELLAATNRASDALRAKIRDEKFDIPTFAAEMPQTLEWLAKSAKDMLDAYNFVRKGKWVEYLPKNDVVKGRRRRKRLTKKIFTFTRRDGSVYSYKLAMDRRMANRYLEWRFAVEPLVRDMDSIIELTYSSGVKPKIQRVASVVRETKVITSQVWQMTTSTVDARAGCWVSVKANNAFRYGLNPLVTLWNLTPYSFMVDVVLPVGRYLGNMATDLGVVYLSTWTSTLESNLSVTTPPNTAVLNHGVSTNRLDMYTRKAGLPPNEFPSFRDAKNAMKSSLDALALIRQRLTSFHR